MDEFEIEIKAYCSDLSLIREKLDEEGADFIKTQREEDRYFNHPARDFKKTDEALRLRNIGNTSILTYKGPKLSDKSKARVEKEALVDKDKDMCDILGLLGFVESGRVVKNRDYYKINGITICLDYVEGLGSFVEIEKKGSDIDLVENELFHISASLGLEKHERKSYLELLMR